MTKSSKLLHQCLTLSIVAVDEFSIGVASGWLAPTLNSLTNPDIKGEFLVSPEESSWIASLDNVGKIFGAIFTAIVLDMVGRKFLLMSSAFTFFIMWVISHLARSATVLCLVRFLFGVFVGINDGTNSTYLAENSSPVIRNLYGCICIALFYVGVLVEFVIATYLTYKQASAVNAFLTFLAFTSVIWVKEPVQYLLMKGKHIQAERNFAWLHGYNVLDTTQWKPEFEKIKRNVQQENLKKTSFVNTITSPANYKSLLIMIPIYCLAGASGWGPIMSYASVIFSSTETLTSNEFTVLFGIIQTVLVVPTSLFVGRFDRRPIIMMSFLIVSASQVVIFFLFYINKNIVPVPNFAWAIFIAITFSVSVNAFVYPAVFLIRGELFPLSIKAIGTCFSIVGYSATNFIVSKIFLLLTRHFGVEINFLLYAVFNSILVGFVYFFLPETRNKSLIEIQEMIEKSKH